jgi:arylsulfatase A
MLLAALLLAASGGAAAAADDRPSFIVIVADDLGWGDLAGYGHPTIRTPNIDRLAGDGVRFTAAYAAAPVCSPARAGLLTGRIPARTGIYDWIPPGSDVHLPAHETTVATLLRSAGYDTCFLGKWHLNGSLVGDQPQPDDHGFDHWFATAGFAMPSHRDPFNFARNGAEVGPLEGYACQLVTDEAIRWLDRRRGSDRPFLMMVSYHEPHELIASPPELVASYPTTQNRDEAEYFANVTHLDEAVGRLLEALNSRGLDHETVVLFTSDNGPEMINRHPQAQRSYGSAGPFRGRKLQLWEGGIRVPLIVRWPAGAPAGSVSDEPVAGIDVLPTLAELAGVRIPQTLPVDGASLVPALSGGSIARETPLFWYHYKAWGGPRAVLRQGRWKLAGYWDGPEILRTDSSTMRPGDLELIRTASLIRFELYDLVDDPGERHDVAAEHPELAATLTARMILIHEDIQRQSRSWTESWLRRW